MHNSKGTVWPRSAYFVFVAVSFSSSFSNDFFHLRRQREEVGKGLRMDSMNRWKLKRRWEGAGESVCCVSLQREEMLAMKKKNDDHDDEKKEMNGSWVAKRGQKCCCCCFKGLLYISVTNLVARKIHRKNDDVNRVNTSSSGCSIHFLVLIS